jgi:hypothetical protein
MRSKKDFERNVHKLRHSLMTAACISSCGVPDTLRAGSEFSRMGPDTGHNRELKSIAEYIDGAMEAFNGIQIAMGLGNEDQARFEHCSTGLCRRCGESLNRRLTELKHES